MGAAEDGKDCVVLTSLPSVVCFAGTALLDLSKAFLNVRQSQMMLGSMFWLLCVL